MKHELLEFNRCCRWIRVLRRAGVSPAVWLRVTRNRPFLRQDKRDARVENREAFTLGCFCGTETHVGDLAFAYRTDQSVCPTARLFSGSMLSKRRRQIF
jgi:hypothetical protein